uniref:Ribosomal protein S3 n=1 Tax=Capsaspora owczarzaki TaxID=192875 RepID=M1KF67_9EUKA|nr:ribosomal protein S3 [Capsaspora owczarzaki]
MYKKFYRNQSNKLIKSSLAFLEQTKSQSLRGHVSGITVRIKGRIKGPIAQKQMFKAGHVSSKTLNKPVRNYNHQIRTQVGIIGVRITTG